jgi:hypothetical protein
VCFASVVPTIWFSIMELISGGGYDNKDFNELFKNCVGVFFKFSQMWSPPLKLMY